MKRTPLYSFGKWLLAGAARVIFPYTVFHAENCPMDQRVVICCNHMGMSDPIRLVYTQERQIFFMSKSELFENKPFGWLLRKLGVFSVQRGKGDREAINMAGNLLEENCAVGIFVEGTRSKDGRLGQPKAGAVMLAYKYNAPILPVCITPVDSRLPRVFHRAIVSYGELIPPDKLGIQEGTGMEFRKASRTVMARISALREKDLKALGRVAEQI